MRENQPGNYEDQIKLLEDELFMAEKNKKMFHRLWIKWAGESHDIENYRDQLKQLEREHELSESNKEMFYRLWLKWANEHMDIENAINRLNEKIKNTPQ